MLSNDIYIILFAWITFFGLTHTILGNANIRFSISVATAWLENRKSMSQAILGPDRTAHVTVTSYYGFKSQHHNLNLNRKPVVILIPVGSYLRIIIIEYK